MSDPELHTVHMAQGHFEAYKRWLAEHRLMLAGPLPLDLGGESHYVVTPADDHPGLAGDGYDVAREITDEVFGPGSYAEGNRDHPDPAVQAAIHRAERDCNAIEPNQSLANAARCDQPEGHEGWHEGPARGPAAAERPGRHRWAYVTRLG